MSKIFSKGANCTMSEAEIRPMLYGSMERTCKQSSEAEERELGKSSELAVKVVLKKISISSNSINRGRIQR